MWLNNTVHFGLGGRKEHTDMLWGDFEKGRYLHHSNDTWFISSDCNKQVMTRLVSGIGPHPVSALGLKPSGQILG